MNQYFGNFATSIRNDLIPRLYRLPFAYKLRTASPLVDTNVRGGEHVSTGSSAVHHEDAALSDFPFSLSPSVHLYSGSVDGE